MLRYTLLISLFLSTAGAQTKLLRQPTYHHGTIAFSYQGDLWSASEDGTGVKRLTTHRSREIEPHFSPDGKRIAFASNRMGSYDVFVMLAGGGEATQLTFHSASDSVVGWSADGKGILFTSARGDGVFPTVANLYEVPADGGMEKLVPTDWGSYGSYSPDGKLLAFTRHPANWTRKHYRGSYATDVWVMDVAAKTYKPLADPVYHGNMMFPQFGAKGEVFFVADRMPNEKEIKAGSPEVMKSTYNIWKISGGKWEQVTRHTSGTLTAPSISSDGKVLVYEENHGLWKLDTATGKTAEIRIQIVTDAKDNEMEWKMLSSTAESYSLSPSGKRAAIAAAGEIFTVATDRGEPQRVTESQRRETSPTWSPNGKWIAYFSDQSGRGEIWISDELGRNRKKLTDQDTEKLSLSWANDSKSLLFAANDNKLYQLNIETGQASVVAQSESRAISNARFSPDDKWISYVRISRDARPHVYVKPIAGGEEKLIGVDDLFSARDARWTADGKKLILAAGVFQQGMASLGRRSSVQLYSVTLGKEDKNPLSRGVDTEEEAVAQTPAGANARGGQQVLKPDISIDWEGLPKRIRQITRLGDSVGGFAIAPDSRTIAFHSQSIGTQDERPVEGLWTIQESGERLTQVARPLAVSGDENGPTPPGRGGAGGFGGGLSSPQWARDGRTLYFQERDGIYSVPVAAVGADGERSAGAGISGLPTRKRVSFNLRVEVDKEALRAQVFDEGWSVMKNRFYDQKMHGVNWAQVKDTYASLLPHVGDTEELQMVMMEMIGELNASHTGVSGGTQADRSIPQTRSPGFELEADASGYYRVVHVFRKGPADKDFLKIKKGDFVLAMNSKELKQPESYWAAFTRSTNNRWEFLVNDKPTQEGAWKVDIEPIAAVALGNLKYEKWVDDRRAIVERASNGEMGYLHIRAMDAPSLRKFELDLAENRFKNGLVIDQRFNGGGGIDQELLQILAQRMYQKTQSRGGLIEERPQRAYFGPMVVLQNERSASDAEMFPDGFRALGLGKLIGVPTYGAVIGTGAFGLMDGASIRTPGAGVYTATGQNMENYGVPPDVYVDNTPDGFKRGVDAQVEKAVEVLRTERRK